jgi:hypothetical protein
MKIEFLLAVSEEDFLQKQILQLILNIVIREKYQFVEVIDRS